MKNFEKTVVTGLALGAAFGIAALAPSSALAHGDAHHDTPHHDANHHDANHKGTHAQQHKAGHKDQHVTVTVDAQGYHPALVNVKAGQEVHMAFVSKGESCANGVSIPALKKTLHLTKGHTQEVTFTPKKGQIIAFACSMNMFKGKVVAK